MNRISLRRAIVSRAGALVGALVTCSGTANAQPWDYQVNHRITLGAAFQPNTVFRGFWDWRVNARTQDVLPVLCTDNGDLLPNQGRLSFASNLAAPGVPPGAVGMPVNDTKTNIADNCPATFAKTEAQITAAIPVAANPRLVGTHEVRGVSRILAFPQGFRAHSSGFSTVGLKSGTMNAAGQVKWKSGWRINGVAGWSTRGRDPLDFRIMDLDTGFIWEDTLWDTTITIDGEGTSIWEDGMLNINALDGSFFLDFGSPLLSTPGGTMSLQFANGLVTSSASTGIFAGLLPAVGAASTSILIPIGDSAGEVTMDYNLAGANTSGYEVTLQMAGEGESDKIVPGPTVLGIAGVALVVTSRVRSRRRV